MTGLSSVVGLVRTLKIVHVSIFMFVAAIAFSRANAQQYLVTLIPAPGYATSFGTSISGSGYVTGYLQPAGDTGATGAHAFLYSNGATKDLGLNGGDYSVGQGVNDSFQATGDYGAGSDAFLYSDGVMQDLGTFPGGCCTEAIAINTSGQITGQTYSSGNPSSHAFLYSGGVFHDLGTLGGVQSIGESINSSGQITGVSSTAGNTANRVFRYSNGVMQDLGGLAGANTVDSIGTSINTSGEIAGYSNIKTSTAFLHAFLYSNGVMHNLGTLGGLQSYAFGINDNTQVVGSSATGVVISEHQVFHAFVYGNGQMVDLNTLISSQAAKLYTLTSAAAVNNSGQIVVNGYVNSGPKPSRAFLLTPK